MNIIFLTVDRLYLSAIYFIHSTLHLLYTFILLFTIKKHDIYIKYIVYLLCRCAWVGVFSKWKELFPMQLILNPLNSKVRLNILYSLCLQISSYVHYAKNWYFKDLSQRIEGVVVRPRIRFYGDISGWIMVVKFRILLCL